MMIAKFLEECGFSPDDVNMENLLLINIAVNLEGTYFREWLARTLPLGRAIACQYGAIECMFAEWLDVA